MSIDMWSTGCTLFELATGKILFPGRTNNHMLKVIMETLGKFPRKLIRQGEFRNVHFDSDLNLKSQEIDKISKKPVSKTIIFTKPVETLETKLGITDVSQREDYYKFLDLLQKSLELLPERRLTVREALQHPFLYE